MSDPFDDDNDGGLFGIIGQMTDTAVSEMDARLEAQKRFAQERRAKENEKGTSMN